MKVADVEFLRSLKADLDMIMPEIMEIARRYRDNRLYLLFYHLTKALELLDNLLKTKKGE